MSIPSISEVAPISLFSTALTAPTSNAAEAGTAATTSAATSPATSTPVAATASSAVTTPAATASFSATSSADLQPGLVSQLESSVTYSTTVGGKNYFGSVAPYDGQYQATVNELPGADATGASIDLAETNLNSLINFLV